MTYLTGDVWIAVGKHRLYPYFENLLISVTGIMRALQFAHTLLSTQHMQPIVAYKSNAQFAARQFPLTLTLPQTGPLEQLLQGRRADVIQLRFGSPPAEAPLGSPRTVPVGTLHTVFANALSPTFVQFYEDNCKWVEKNVNSDVHKWPAAWNFGRVIRNAMSHGGSINIDSKVAPNVSWHHLTYGHDQNKQRVIGTELYFTDLMILMIEMADDLDRANAPYVTLEP